MPMTLSLVAASILGGQAMTRSGKYKSLAFFGLAVTMVGMYLLSTMTTTSPHPVVLSYIVIVGLGLGIGIPVFNLAIQNAVDHGHLGVATATGQLFRQLGGTIGVAVMGTVMAHTMHNALAEKLAKTISLHQQARLPLELMGHLENPQLLLSPGKLAGMSHALPPDLRPVLQQVIVAMRESLNTGLSHVFLGASAAMLLAVVMVFFLKEVPLRTTMHK